MSINQQVAGMNSWFKISTTRGDSSSGSIDVPFGHFPDQYLPAKNFQAQALSFGQFPSPWAALDPLTALAIGGATGTLIGLLGAMAQVSLILSQKLTTTFGIGYHQEPTPTVGFCIGDIYKENTYFKYDVAFISPLVPLITSIGIDVSQRSKFKRMYLHHGEIDSVTTDTNANSLTFTLDYVGNVSSNIITNISNYQVKIIKKTGQENDYPIKTFNTDFSITLDSSNFTDPSFYPATGDFYRISQPLCLEDPFLMSGTWVAKDTSSDGGSLYFSDHNQGYVAQNFTGAYIYVNQDDLKIVPIAADTPFKLDATNTWLWISLANAADSEIYQSNLDRYYERAAFYSNAASSGTTSTVIDTIFLTGIESEINDWMKSNTYLRLELANGGQAGRQNWHSPMLKKCWVKQNGKYFKIIGQPDGNVIDVSIKDISNTVSIDYTQTFDIFNQYAWMISEHSSSSSSSQNTYFISGNISNQNYNSATDKTTFSITTNYISSGTTLYASPPPPVIPLNNSFSFYNRFSSTYLPTTSEPLALWSKFKNWKLITNTGISYNISSITFPSGSPLEGESFTITGSIFGKINSSNGYIIFDSPYSTTNQLDSGLNNATITQDGEAMLDFDMEYLSYLTSVDIPSNTMVGVCGGVLWGIDTSLTSSADNTDISGGGNSTHFLSNNGLDLYVLTKTSSNGIDAFKHRLNNTEWIFFMDSLTQKLSIRKGSINFRDRPKKTEISVGLPSLIETQSSFPIVLNQNQQRTRCIEFSLPDSQDDNSSTSSDQFGKYAITFQSKTQDGYFGTQTEGSGVVDFQALRMAGYVPNTSNIATSSDFLYDSKYISPVYVWKKVNKIESNNKGYLQIGLPTSEQYIYTKNYNISSPEIKIEYINDNQTFGVVLGNYYAFNLNDGRSVLIYEMPLSKAFSFTNTSSTITTSAYGSPTGIFVIETTNDGITWGCPYLDYQNNAVLQQPVMLLYGCTLQSAYHDEANDSLGIITQCYTKPSGSTAATNFTPFYGIYNLSLKNIPQDSLQYAKTPTFSFLYRINQLSEDIWTSDISFASKDVRISIPGGLVPVNTNDRFTRIIGTSSTQSHITVSQNPNLGISTAKMIADGRIIWIYADPQGIRLISWDGGIWQQSSIIIAKGGTTAYFLKNVLFFTDSEGLKIKINMYGSIIQAIGITNSQAGVATSNKETIQRDIDNKIPILITSKINTATRLSAFISFDGTYNVTCYSNSILKCYSSIDLMVWKENYNF